TIVNLRIKMTIVPMLRVGMQFMTLCVTSLRRTEYQDRTQSVQNGVPTRSVGTIVNLRIKMTIVPMLRVGMQFVTL
ncbi:hypothetical protein ALP53_01949, partial [Pseudomonas savastanoi pv. phaseolicola]